MNLLQLTQAVKLQGGISGPTIATTVNQPEETQRIVSWVNAAWLDIQTLHNEWEFMRSSFSFNTVAGTSSYSYVAAGLPSIGQWKKDSFRKYLVSSGVGSEMYLPYLDYNTFRNMYLFGQMRTTQAPPVTFTIDPQKNILLGNVPDGIYTINGEAFTAPTTLSADTDSPTMPSQFHMAIVWRALGHYGMYEAAAEAVARGRDEYGKLLSRLEADQLPQINFGAPLA